MINIFLRGNIQFLFIIIVVYEIKTSEVPRPRGVSLSRAPLYAPDKDFVCLDGSLTIPFLQVNDNYCDCSDGSDEPGTSACSNGVFYCTNAGHKPLIIPSSRVNDGICDCCDASDEYANPSANCVNNCNELGRSARAEAQKRAELIKLGSQLRAELSQKGVLLKQEKKEKLLILNRNKNEAEQLRKEKEDFKKEAEALENVALQAYKQIEEEQQKNREIEENEKTRIEAREAFDKFDSNRNGKLELSELQTRPTFDRDRNGEITEEEAKYFLDENTEIEFEDFLTVAWPKIKPFMMLESGLFKPPTEEQATEADEMQEAIGDEEPEHHDEEEPEQHEDDEQDLEETEDNEEDSENESEANKEELVSNKPIYDEETQNVINQATYARNEFSTADRTLKDIQNEIKNIEDSLEKDYGVDEEFAALDGNCFEYNDREYIYKLCPFDQVIQKPKSGGSDTRLGTWGSWVGVESSKYDVMLYDRGQSCWNGPQRTTHVRVLCGSENVVTSVAEPNRCEYVMDFTTPAACNPALVEKSNEDTHDEL